MKITGLRLGFLVFALLIPVVFSSTASSRVSGTKEKKLSALIKVTPQAPAFVEAERLAELAQRRARVAQWIGNKGFLVLFSGEARVYANDVDYPFRQENNLFYLTHLKQKGRYASFAAGQHAVSGDSFSSAKESFGGSVDWTHVQPARSERRFPASKRFGTQANLSHFMRPLRNRQPYRPKPENVFLSDLPASFEFQQRAWI